MNVLFGDEGPAGGDDRDVVVVAGCARRSSRPGRCSNGPTRSSSVRIVVREAIERADVDPLEIDEVIVGNIGSPADAANIARVIALAAKVPKHVPAFTVNRNCASGIEAIVEAGYRIRAGDADLVVAGAVESMSQIPLLFSPDRPASVDATRPGQRSDGEAGGRSRVSAHATSRR